MVANGRDNIELLKFASIQKALEPEYFLYFIVASTTKQRKTQKSYRITIYSKQDYQPSFAAEIHPPIA